MLNNIVWLLYFYYYNFVMKHWRSFFVTLFQGCRTYLLTYWFLFNLIGILGRVWVDPWKVLPFLCFLQKKKNVMEWCLEKASIKMILTICYICLCKYFDVYLLKLIYHVESYLTIKRKHRKLMSIKNNIWLRWRAKIHILMLYRTKIF